MGSIPLQEAIKHVQRFYAEKEDVSQTGCYLLAEDDIRHAFSVLRIRSGDTVELIYEGRRSLASVVEASASRISVHPFRDLPATEPSLRVTLIQGLPKFDKMDFIVQKAVELGVHEIIPVLFSRCTVKVDQENACRKLYRWEKIAREAGMQSGRIHIPSVHPFCSVHDLSSVLSGIDAAVVPWEECDRPGPKAFSKDHPHLHSLAIVIGPEGGIEASEISLLQSMNVQPITLGKRIMRTETAGIAAISSFMCLYNEME